MSNDRILYKYRGLTKDSHWRLLTTNEIYFSSPQDFNDPFDCAITPNFSLLNSDEKIDQFVDRIVTSAKNADASLDIEKNRKNFKERLTNDFDKTINAYRELHKQQQVETYGIFSLSRHWDSILMWSHYSENHTGFCVGFKMQKLREIKEFSLGQPVEYGDEFPEIDPLDEDLLKTHIQEVSYKAKSWEYEGEFRLFTHIGPTIKDRHLTLPDDSFSEIILGLRFPDNQIERMKSIAKQKRIKLFRTIKADRQFRLDRIEIEIG